MAASMFSMAGSAGSRGFNEDVHAESFRRPAAALTAVTAVTDSSVSAQSQVALAEAADPSWWGLHRSWPKSLYTPQLTEQQSSGSAHMTLMEL